MTTTDAYKVADAIHRHRKRHPRPVSGCMVCDARYEYEKVLVEWLDKQLDPGEVVAEVVDL